MSYQPTIPPTARAPRARQSSGPGFHTRFVFYFSAPAGRGRQIAAALIARGYVDSTPRGHLGSWHHPTLPDPRTRTFERRPGVTVRLTIIPEHPPGVFVCLAVTRFRVWTP